MSTLHFTRLSKAQASNILEPIGVDIFTPLEPCESTGKEHRNSHAVIEVWTNAIPPPTQRNRFPLNSLCSGEVISVRNDADQAVSTDWSAIRAVRMRATNTCLSKLRNIDDAHYRAIIFPTQAGRWHHAVLALYVSFHSLMIEKSCMI